MSETASDDGWEKIQRELHRPPRVDAASGDRIMARVRSTARVERSSLLAWLTQRHVLALTPAHMLAAALVTVLIAAVGRSAWSHRRVSSVAATTAPSARGVQFTFVGKAAARVSVAGDFNNWDPSATPMKRVANANVWSVVVPLAPGRYVYSFVVDGVHWVTDTAAPRAPSGEYGQANSVAYVKADNGET